MGRQGECLLRDVSFHVRHGETVAIVGRSERQKNQRSRPGPRFYDVKGRNLCWTAVDVREFDDRRRRR